MITQTIPYQYKKKNFLGYLARPEKIENKLPAIIIAHAWHGQDKFARKKAEDLASLGYIGFALDLYGDGATANNNEDALKLMLPLFLDRTLLRERMGVGLETVRQQPFVNQESIGAIGFCFGGLSVIELLRSGTKIKGVVSFHGLLGNVLDNYTAALVPNSEKIHGSLLILHGFKDPLVSQLDVQKIQDEMTKANVDWEMDIYGLATHAFTNPEANDHQSGMVYNHLIDERAWLAMINFFNRLFRS